MYWKVRTEVVFRHTGELPIEISGPDAESLLNRKFTRDVSKVKVGRCSYQFARRYTDENVALLVVVDGLNYTPNGLAVKKLFERVLRVHGDLGYRRLAGISVSHIYNLCNSKGIVLIFQLTD